MMSITLAAMTTANTDQRSGLRVIVVVMVSGTREVTWSDIEGLLVNEQRSLRTVYVTNDVRASG
jgi:hypothetical protein